MNKKITISLLSSLIVANITVFGQSNNDAVLMTIGDKKISKAEFETIFHKNTEKKDNSSPEKSLKEYLEMFINFKLKVLDAEAMGMDTSANFNNELKGYRKQLAQPYLTDNEVNESLMKEAYDRMKTEVRASHILIKVDETSLPKDTLIAYNKIMKISERIMKGEDFAKVAASTSEDPSAKDNAGDLGYFSALQMVYSFETAAFTTPLNQVSTPVRTRFGYHILKVYDKRPARGQIQVAHIMIKAPANSPKEDSIAAKNKIEEIYTKVKAGEDFGKLAEQFSDDKNSAKKGGELPWFGTGRMVPDFENAAFGLEKNGDISAPIKTQYGWHIIKKMDKKDIQKYDEMKTDLKTKIAKDSRSQRTRESLVAKIKKENNFKEDLKAKNEFVKLIDKSFFEGKWKADVAKNFTKTMFNLNDKIYTQQDFAKYLESKQTKRSEQASQLLINNLYSNFVGDICINYQDANLEKRFPEFRALLNEYRDGILLFELTDKKVWGKAIKDSVGLQKYYNDNKSHFMWGERVDATIYTCANEDIAKQTRKLVKKAKKKKMSNDMIFKIVNAKSQLNLRTESNKYSKGDNEIIDGTPWVAGISENIKKNNQIIFVQINNKLAPEPKSLNDAKGLVAAEFQTFLEKEWINGLKKKYQVTINDEVLSTVK